MIEGYAGGAEGQAVADMLAMMRRASLLIRQLESYFSAHGLSQLRFLFLIVIDREQERRSLTIGEIGDRLDVSGPVIARTLRSLLADKLVRTMADKKDGRSKHVSLTREGERKLEALMPGYIAILAQAAERP